MHLHILGICGTFMGGIAALAKAAGHRVTGCDANVYPPMSDQLAALGIALTEGYDAAQLTRRREGCRRLRRRQRRHAREPADGGDPRRRPSVHVRTAVALRERAPRQVDPRGRGNTRQDDDGIDAGVDPRARGTRSGIPDRRRAARLRHLGASHRQRVLRDRRRRVRHGVLRQALEVRPLPAAHGDSQQSRIRSRRHLRRPGGDRDAVPPLRAHGATLRKARRERRGGKPRPRARARLLVGSRAFR